MAINSMAAINSTVGVSMLALGREVEGWQSQPGNTLAPVPSGDSLE